MNGSYANGYGARRRLYDDAPAANTTSNSHPEDPGSDTEYDPYSSRRPGGYGGFGPSQPRSGGRRLYGQPQASQPPVQPTPQPVRSQPQPAARLPDVERRRAQRRSGSRSRAPRGEGQAAQDIEDILRYIQRDWSFMTEDQCVPAKVALQLLDDSSLGLARRYDEFQDAQMQLQSALRAIVNEHHQGFNSSIGTFHQIQASIQASHDRVRALKTSLVEAKSNLSTASPEFTELATKSHNFQEMLDVLAIIEHVQQLPEKLEASMSEKRFLTAVELLQDALRMIRRPELEGIGALAETRVYLSNQEHSLVDILIEELHNHLYLKSPYCEDRWQAYTKPNWSGRPKAMAQTGGRELMYEFLEKLDTSQPMNDDASRNPESDSFQYIFMIAEALNRLDRLSEAINTIEERLPIELFKVVERSNGEIQQRHPSAQQMEWRNKQGALVLPTDGKDEAPILTDLLETLYAKFEAISESHRVFHEVVSGIGGRDTTYSSSSLTRSFRELWKLYQSEMRSLLHDYLSTRGTIAERMRKDNEAESNVFRYQRDKTKKTPFKMDLVDASLSDMRNERDDVLLTWQRFVPGIASLTQDSSASSLLTGANYNETSSAAGHQLLVEPSVFNIVHLLPPSVSFLNRLKAIVPPTSNVPISTLSSFLGDFLVNVFHPQLEETLADYCSQAFSQLDAFQHDPQWEAHSHKPIYRGTIAFYKILVAFSRVLDNLTHDQMFTHLIITQINNYYDRCNNWYKTLVTRAQVKADGRTLKQAAFLAEQKPVTNATQKASEADSKDKPKAVEAENRLLVETMQKQPLDASDLNCDRKTLGQLCLLQTSMKWLAIKLSQLRRVTDRAADSTVDGDADLTGPPPLKRSLTTSLEQASADTYDKVYLPLTTRSAGLLDGMISAFHDLSGLALRTVHLELRCDIIMTATPLFRGQYILHEPVEAADEDVLKLVGDMSVFDREMKTHLSSSEYSYVVDGCSALVDSILIHNATTYVKNLNAIGAEHLELNARVLYHNLLNMEPGADLVKTFEFFRLFDEGPNAIVAHAWKGKLALTHDQLKSIVELWHSEDLEGQDQTRSTRAEKVMGEHLVQLGEALSRG